MNRKKKIPTLEQIIPNGIFQRINNLSGVTLPWSEDNALLDIDYIYRWYIIGFALIFFGIFQLVVLVGANRVMPVGPVAFFLPSLVLAGGVLLVLRPGFIGSAIGVVAGIVLILYGASELLSSWKMKKVIDEYEIHEFGDNDMADDQTIDEQ